MVKILNATLSLTLLACVGACESSNPSTSARNAAAGQESTKASPAARRTQPPPAIPPNFCSGGSTLDDVRKLVTTGGATLAVEATAQDNPTTDGDNDRLVSLTNVMLEAGSESAGDVSQVHETDTPQDNQLPPSTYILLLGVNASFQPEYYLADGMQGSFLISDGDVFQRCPNYQDPSNPTVSKLGVPIDDFLANVRQAIAENSSAPTDSEAPASTTAPSS